MFIEEKYINPDHITNISYTVNKIEDTTKRIFKVNKFSYFVVSDVKILFELKKSNGIFEKVYHDNDKNFEQMEEIFPRLKYIKNTLTAHITLSCGTKFSFVLANYSYHSKIKENNFKNISPGYTEEIFEIEEIISGEEFDTDSIDIEKVTRMLINEEKDIFTKKEKVMIWMILKIKNPDTK